MDPIMQKVMIRRIGYFGGQKFTYVVAASAGNKNSSRPQGEDVEPDWVRDVPPEEQDHRSDVQDKAGDEQVKFILWHCVKAKYCI